MELKLPPDFAPLLRRLAFIAVLAVVVPFALAMKGGAFRHESVFTVLLIAAGLLAGGIAFFIWLDTEKVQNWKLLNPLHPDNKPSEPE